MFQGGDGWGDACGFPSANRELAHCTRLRFGNVGLFFRTAPSVNQQDPTS
jgi:hypothetical protein